MPSPVWVGRSLLLLDIVLKKKNQLQCSSFPCKGLGCETEVRPVERFLPETGVLSGTTPKFQMARAMLSQRKEAEEIVPWFLFRGLCSCSESGPSPLTVSDGLLRILLINSIVVQIGQSLG